MTLYSLNLEFSIKYNLIENEVNNYQYQFYSKFKFNTTTFNGVLLQSLPLLSQLGTVGNNLVNCV